MPARILTWTPEIPSVTGYYWHKSENIDPHVVYIYYQDGFLCVDCQCEPREYKKKWYRHVYMSDFIGDARDRDEWAGPISLPKRADKELVSKEVA